MKTFSSLLLLLGACHFAAAQAVTNPVGYVKIGDTTDGQPAIKANTDVVVSIPLHRPAEFYGNVASATATTITLSGSPAWTSNQWASAGAPYLVTVTSGTENGFTGLITANTASALTVTPVTLGSLTNLTSADTIKIHPAWTLISLFPSGTFSPGVRVLAFSGTYSGINIAPDLNYVWSGTNWLKGVTVSNSDILYTGEAFIIRSSGTAVQTLTVTGEVPDVKSRTVITKLVAGVAQDTRIGYLSPVDEVIGDSGLSSALTAGDQLYAFNNSTQGINKAPTVNLVWSGTNWYQGVTIVTSSYPIQAGQGYMIRRKATAPQGATDWVDRQTYLAP